MLVSLCVYVKYIYNCELLRMRKAQRSKVTALYSGRAVTTVYSTQAVSRNAEDILFCKKVLCVVQNKGFISRGQFGKINYV